MGLQEVSQVAFVIGREMHYYHEGKLAVVRDMLNKCFEGG
jgi:hypothetical protein